MNTPEMIFAKLYKDYPSLGANEKDIYNAYLLIKKCAQEKAFVYCCGNGGSAADSEHITGELMKGFILKRPLPQEEKALFDNIEGGPAIASRLQKGIRCISLVSQSGVISAFANDIDPSLIYAQQVYAYAKSPHDVLIALSTSGNSLNVVNAVKTARAAGIKTVSITGEKESRLSALSAVTIKLPTSVTYEVQELTLPVYHALCAAVEAALFSE